MNTTDILSNSSFSNDPNLLGITLFEFWLQEFFYAIFGGLSALGYTTMAIGFIRDKAPRKRFFIILCFLVFIRAILGLQFFIVCVFRIFRAFGFATVYLKRMHCFILHMQFFYTFTAEMVLLIVLVIDRALAILAYNYYRTLTNRQAIVCCSIACVLTIALKMAPSVIGVNFNDDVACVNTYSPMALVYARYQNNIDLGMVLLILIIYMILIFWVRFRIVPKLSATNPNGDQSDLSISLKRQMKLLSLLRRTGFIHCGFALPSKVMLSLISYVPRYTGLRLATYAGILLVIDLFCNLIMLLITNGDLRNMAIPCTRASAIAPGDPAIGNRSKKLVFVFVLGVPKGEPQIKFSQYPNHCATPTAS